MSARQPVLDLHPEEYFQVAAVGYRDGKDGPEFLLVRTGSGRWTFPKGQVEPALGARRSAQREAREEAGAYGAIEAFPFAAYCTTKNGKCYDRPSEFLVYAYLLHVTQEGEPLEAGREPNWVTAKQAKRMLRWNRSEPYATHIATMIDLAVAAIERGQDDSVASWRAAKPALGNLYEIS